MLTDNYLKKIKPFISFYKFIYKTRFYLISGGVLLAATGAALLGVKGIIYHNVEIRSGQYGDSLIYNAKSIFNTDDIKYEFRKCDINSTWTTIEPTKVGNYEIRAVSSNIFGSPIYGEPSLFSIKPRKIKPIIEESYTYGEPISFKFELKEGDELKFEEYEVVDFVNSPKVVINENSFKFGNELNEDITSCYDVDLTPIDVKLSPRSISLKASLKKTYDGKPLTVEKCEDIVEGSLAYKDSIAVTKSDSITNAGIINDNDIDLEFNNLQEGNVSLLYNYKFVEHSLTIDKRELTVALPDVTKTYDGKFTNLGEYTFSEGTLISGHKLELEFNQYVNACKEIYRPKTYKVIDADGNDVTSNYKIDFIGGNLTINPAPISVKVGDGTFVYDGTAHENNEFILTSGTLIDGHQLKAEKINPTTMIDVGSYENNLAFSVVDGANNQVSSNYDITVTKGTITINKRPIVIATADIEVPYNGDYTVMNYDAATLVGGTLPTGHYINIIPKVYVGIEIDGSCNNELEVKINDSNGIDVTSNYDITFKYGKVTVTKGSLKIKTDSKFYIYQEGKEYSAPSFSFVEDPVLPAGHKVNYKEDYTRVNKPGRYSNILNMIVLNEKEEDVTDKFNIEMQYGMIVVFDENDNSLDGGGSSSTPGINIEEENKPNMPIRPAEGDNNQGGEQKPNVPSNPIDPETPNEEGQGGSNNPQIPPEINKYSYTSTYKGPIYFKQNTYLDSTGTAPTKAPNYPIQSGDVNPNLYISNLLNTTNWYKINVNSTLFFGRDLIPQYIQKFDDEQLFDTFIVLSNKETPEFYFNPYDYLIDGEDDLDINLIEERNKGYSLYEDYVKQKYLGVEELLKEKILAEVDKYNLVGETEYMTIYNIARYITKYHTIDISYAGPENVDFVENFLFGDKRSNEFIYALSTVKMLRSLGIPARIATGYVDNSLKNDKGVYNSSFTNDAIKNSWVEVYSSKFKAFVSIDPFRKTGKDYILPEPEIDSVKPETPQEPENPQKPETPQVPEKPQDPEKPQKPEKPEEPQKPEEPEEFKRDPVTQIVRINTLSGSWTYDGKRHKEESYYIADGNLLSYDKLVVSSAPSIKNYTKNPVYNKLRFKVIDTRSNKDVTREYSNFLKIKYGTLTIDKSYLNIYTASKSKSYDGTKLTGSFEDLSYSSYSLAEGDQILSQYVRWFTWVKDYGTSCDNICVVTKIVNSSGDNVINNYKIDYTYGTLSIY